MAKILVIGDPTTPLNQVRGPVGQRDGHHIFWFSSQQAALPGVTHFTLPGLARRNSFLRALLKPFFLYRAIKKIQPDLVHVHYAQTGLMVFPLRKCHPLVVTVMGGDILPDQGYHGLAAFFIRLLLDQADCITSKSDFMDTTLNKIGCYDGKIRRVTWGIDLNHFHPERNMSSLRSRWSIPHADLIFFDARLATPFYKKHIIMEAFAGYLKEGGPSATLLVAEAFADPAYTIRLRQQAHNLKIADKIRFVGSIPYSEMPDYYVLSDITISVPPSDGLPQTIYEAFACGSFLILGDLPQYVGVAEDGVTARLVKVNDVKALKEALLWASAHPEIRQAARQIGWEYVNKHADFNTQAVLVNQIYEELLQKADKGKSAISQEHYRR